ncbi:MAG: hypothetical protein K9J16_18140 [Melioribacteraceae bacterium]|nr:hypothetical protein [Melioribacteraceae bacterium]MCF8356755.1 hypothetical protein [Melioribacteraceae bacterium]MCF8396140.1 hypothetical protein [Melioribacteraceae bacterium]MCF8421117.1 hypothetical protein [Melioribacteraceae bacterium]
MNYEDFLKSIKNDKPDPGMNKYLSALWHDAKGDWDKAHTIVQNIPDKTSAWIHAYLHRKEGDEWNAGYWYRNADKSFSELKLEDEWEEITKEIINKL